MHQLATKRNSSSQQETILFRATWAFAILCCNRFLLAAGTTKPCRQVIIYDIGPDIIYDIGANITGYRTDNIKRGQDKINSVVSKLENMSMEELAKILIEARKTKLLEV